MGTKCHWEAIISLSKQFNKTANYQDTWKIISTINSEGSAQSSPNSTGQTHPPTLPSGMGSLVAGGLTLGLAGSHFKDKTGW